MLRTQARTCFRLVQPVFRLYSTKPDFDLLVIGGGSGGISCAREAAKLGKKVACFDYVVPSPHGTKWGLGGTCVNVGCIPKKLFHHAGALGNNLKTSNRFGWSVGKDIKHDWKSLAENVNNYIRSLNWGYRSDLMKNNVQYENALVKFEDEHTISAKYLDQPSKTWTSKEFLIAVGGRPNYPDIPGAKLAISSDDLFTLPEPPGKTLIIGASYVALETAGFLSQMGIETKVLARSVILRGYDQQMAEMIVDHMTSIGTEFHRNAEPVALEQNPETGILVSIKDKTTNVIRKELFDTVVMATGRIPSTNYLNLTAAGVEVASNGKLDVVSEQTNIDHIYAIGDVLNGKPELTPVAVQAGKLLARRLYGNSPLTMDYFNVPTCVFTPLEYGCCGYTEEEATKEFGLDNIEVFHTHYTPVHWGVEERAPNICYMKLICNKQESMKVIGFHLFGEHAGEITQGIAIAIKSGVTKDIFDQTCGIHPTSAEEITTMEITRASGLSPEKSGC